MGRFHFPVGGRRFRPGVEDLIEAMISEGIATGRPGWQAAVEEHRNGYDRKQLGAAVRRAPAIAIQELERLGYRVTEPDA